MNTNREISRPDRDLMRKELERETQNISDREAEFFEMADEMDNAMRKHFPDAFVKFSPPSLDSLQSHFGTVLKIATGEDNENVVDNPNAFNFVSSVRYVDNFIDEALWPIIEAKKEYGTLDKKELEEKFDSFLEDVYSVATKYDTYLPKAILDLPKLEIKMFLNPDQTTFDECIEDYLKNKSYNLAYVDHLMTKERSAEITTWNEGEKNKFQLMALWDVSRDANEWSDSTDFDVFRHVYTNNLDPRKLEVITIEAIKRNSTSLCALIESGNISQLFDYRATQDAMQRDEIEEQEQYLIQSCIWMLQFIEENKRHEQAA